ncbi:hypothetical protein [Arthrobacter rhombi]|uniref:hypothetical protein n=1 Tax=Arthrobacter rhombi TaxID=71253 RepID=UPI003FD542E1
MAYHLERLSRGSVDSRTDVFGSSLDEALQTTIDPLTADGVEFARLMEDDSADSGPGEGRIVAIYTEAEGWHKLVP